MNNKKLLSRQFLLGAVISRFYFKIGRDKADPEKTVLPISFARYFNENFEYFDNTDVGDVYKHKSGDGLYSEEDIFDEWFNNR